MATERCSCESGGGPRNGRGSQKAAKGTLRRSGRAVNGRRRPAARASHGPASVRPEDVRRLLLEGRTPREIGARYGLPVRGVRTMLERRGISPRDERIGA